MRRPAPTSTRGRNCDSRTTAVAMAITPSSSPRLLHLRGMQSVFADALIRRRTPAVNIEARSSGDRRPIYLDSALTTQRNKGSMSVGRQRNGHLQQLQQLQQQAGSGLYDWLVVVVRLPQTVINTFSSLRNRANWVKTKRKRRSVFHRYRCSAPQHRNARCTSELARNLFKEV